MPRFFKRCVCASSVEGLWQLSLRAKQRRRDLRKKMGGRVVKSKVKLTDPCEKYRLFKFPQMDFEMAIWEMTSLLIAPKKVFRSIYYHVNLSPPLFLSSRKENPIH